ncbi:MAG: hypothetical protein J6T10_30330 [Methanobrevibacter sp.]|nr:hypothetical protein [Methanobrevibacter sp.]
MFKRKYELDENVFNEVNNESAYWIGYLYGDGNCTSENKIRIACAQKDKDILIMFRSFIKCISKPIKEYMSMGKYPACGFEIRSWKMKKCLDKYQLSLKKEKRGLINIDLMQDGVSKDFVRGLFDADGTFYYDGLHKNNLYAEITGYMPVMKSVLALLKHNKICSETKNITKNGKIYRIRLASSDCLKFGHFIYDGDPKFKLKRKFGMFKNHLDRLNETTQMRSNSRNMYFRPVSGYNKGKQSEFKERKWFTEEKAKGK